MTDGMRNAAHVRRLLAMALAAAALLSLAACGWENDPLSSLGASLKKVCRSSDSCTVHDPDPGRY
jgi:outer membrane lipopolysaccharide assembly protein LptE/RlpB